MSIITLKYTQKEAYALSLQITNKYGGYFNVSPTGAGKSILVVKRAQETKTPIYVFCSKSVGIVWKKECKKYDVKCTIITYGILAGRTGCDLSHDLLVREDVESPSRGSPKIIYNHTAALTKIVKSKGIFVFDESQNLKNLTTAKSIAASTIIKYIIKARKSKNTFFALLSATPIDKAMQAIVFCRVFDFIKSSKLYDRTGDLIGIAELIKVCRKMERKETDAILAEFDIVKNVLKKKTKAPILVHALYSRVAIKYISISMDLPESEFTHYKANGFFRLTAEEETEYHNIVLAIEKTAGYDESTGAVTINRETMGLIFSLMPLLETSKLPIFARLANKYLGADITNHVVLYLNYTDNINDLAEILEEFNPMVITGNTSLKNREKYIDEFNSGEGSRLLICNTNVGKEGLSLHDTDGGFKRFMFHSPCFSAINSIQSAGRINRTGVMSDTHYMDVYGMVGEKRMEMKLLSSLTEKNQIINSTLYNSTTGEYKHLAELEIAIETVDEHLACIAN